MKNVIPIESSHLHKKRVGFPNMFALLEETLARRTNKKADLNGT